MNRKRRFIDNLPKYICGNDNVEQEEEVSGWIIQRLSTLHKEQFLKCADEMGYPLLIKKMDEDTSEAMWNDANVNTRSARVILRYLKAIFGKKCIFHSQKGMVIAPILVTINQYHLILTFVILRENLYFFGQKILLTF